MCITGIGRGGGKLAACIVPATGAIAAIRSEASMARRYAIMAPFEWPVA
jgi:hypothetical protein